MPVALVRASIALCVLLSIPSRALPADRGVNLQSLLARPASPGSVTLLALYADNERARTRIIEALASPDGDTRAAAARVVNVGAIGEALAALRTALRTESSVAAAVEEVRALLVLDPEGAGPVGLETAERLDREGHQRGADAVLVAFARVRGPATWQQLSRLLAITSSAETWRALVLGATRGGRVSVAETVHTLLASRNANAWQGVLAALSESDVALPQASALDALSAGPDIREPTCWQLALTKREIADDVVHKALGAPPPSDVDWPLSPCEALLRLTSRRMKLTEFLDKVRQSPPDGVSPMLRDSTRVWMVHATAHEQDYSAVRLVAEYPPNVVGDVGAVAGCEWPDSGALVGGVLVVDQQGRPQSGSIATKGLSPACAVSAKALLVTNLAPLGHAPGANGRELVLLAPDKDRIQCLAEEDWLSETAALRAGKGVELPKKVKDVRPEYPLERESGVEGAIAMDVLVSRAGCVETVRVLHRAHVMLDIAAITAVSQWRFVPTLVNGVPVPMHVNVTVTFALH